MTTTAIDNIRLSRSDLKLDGKLAEQLAAADAEAPVEAVFLLRGTGERHIPPADQIKQLATDIINRAGAAAGGATPEAVNIFKHVGSFLVAAKPRLIVELLKQPEIASAMANEQDISI
jgi:hypothetical protein